MVKKVNPPPIELSDGFAEFVKFLDDKGGRYQRHRDLLAADVGVTRERVRRMVDRAEAIGILDVERTGHPVIGVGRFPNTYVLQVTYAQFIEHRADLHAAYVAKKAKSRARQAKRTRRKAVRSLPEVAVPGIAVPTFRSSNPDVDPDLEVDAWQDFGDF